MPFRLYYTRFILGMAIVLLACLTLIIVTGWQQPAPSLSSETLSNKNLNIVAKSKLDKTPDSGLSSADESTKGKLLESYGQLPLHFEPNNGQINSEQVKFNSRGQGYQMFLTPTGATLALRQSTNNKTDFRAMSAKARMKQMSREEHLQKKTDKQAVVEMQILGANQEAQFSGREELEGKSNYFIGNDQNTWRTDIANYKRVRVDEVYSGISLEYYGNQRQLEYDFIVEPNADPSQIKLKYKGIKNVKVNEIGELVLKTSSGEIRQKKPVVYQTDENGERKEIVSSYKLKGKEVGFQLADYDKNKQLIIDPVILVYSTFLGGSGFDTGTAIVVDNQASAYIMGFTQSINFPIQGGFQTTNNGGFDAFVCKFNAAGSQLVYSTFLGGSGNEFQGGTSGFITIDGLGNAYISGATNSSNFPTTPGAFQTNFRGVSDGYVAKLNPTGNQLVFSTYLGGNRFDFLGGIKVDANSNVYVVGSGYSPDMPSTPGVIQPTLRCTLAVPDFTCNDIYIAKFNPNGNQLMYFTYFGSTDGPDFGNRLAIDNSGNAYVTGETAYRIVPNGEQTNNNFPTTSGVVQPNFGGNSDAYVVKINSTATSLIYSTFLGGPVVNGLSPGYDFGWDIAIDSGGNAYITGGTNSSNFPLANPYQSVYGGGSADVFVTKLNATGSAFIYSTYIGGSGYDSYPNIAVDNGGNAYIIGDTSSPNFPQVQSRQTNLSGATDAFVTKLNSTGNQILYSTYHGGHNVDTAAGIAVDNAGNAYVTGGTHSDQNFPLVNPRQSTAGGFFDAFVSKFLDPPVQNHSISGQVTSNGNGASGVIISLSGGVTTRTTTDANGFYVFNNLPSNSYRITPVLENGVFDASSRTVTVTNSNPPPVNFSFTVCPVQLSSTGANVPSAGIFDGSFSVTMSGCPRNVTSNASWLIVTNGETGTGNGTISYVAQKNFGLARSGTITINGQSFTVTQQADPNASFVNGVSGICDTDINFSQSRIVVPHTGGNTNTNFTVNIPSSCGAWSAISNNQMWLRVTSPVVGNVGNQSVSFTVDPNIENTPRSGEITINGQPFTVIQTANFPPEWFLSINPTSGSTLPVGGGRRNFGVSIAGNGRWTTFVPDRKDANWIILPTPPGNSGIYTDTTARFMVLANQTAAPRTGTIVVGDKAYTVTQDGGQQLDCNYQVSSSGQSLGSGTDSTGSFLVSVGNNCRWNAINSSSAWLEITGGSGIGSGTVSFRTTQANPGSTPRTATITVGGRIFSITQNGTQQACSRTINPISQDASGQGVTGIVAVSSTGGCSAFTANSNVGWITATVNNSSQLSYVVQANNLTTGRTGTITAEGQTFTINQAAGSPQRRPKSYDFVGEDKSQISVYRPSNGIWYVLNSESGFSATQFGISTDKIVPADYDGDGKTDIAVYRAGIWYLLRTAQGFASFQFGLSDDIPQPADFDGDGRADLAVYRPSNGIWYVLNLMNNQFTGTQFGISTDKPVVGDYDGDGRAEPAVYRPAGGIWYLLRSTQGFTSMQFGLATDKPVVGDYDGDGRSDIAVYRPSNGVWYLQNSTNGFTATQFGIATDLPVPGDYDGDGRTDLGVYRDGIWYLLNSTSGFTAIQFGLPTDKPAPNAFIPQP